MKKQQTVVEWLIQQLTSQPSSGYYTINGLNVTDVIEKAKEMEKEQIIASHINGNVEYTVGGNYWKVAEQYYNETYGDERDTKSI